MKTPQLILFALSALAVASCTSTPQLTKSNGVAAPVIPELSNIPTAKPDPLGRKNMVLSPYAPYNIIDCKGYKSGDIVGDPSTAQKDANGKIIGSSSKYFLIP